MEQTSKATNRSARIRELIAAHPEWDNKTIATAAGTTSTLVAVVKTVDKRKAAGLPSYKTLHRRKKAKAKARAAKKAKNKPIKFVPAKVIPPSEMILKMQEDTNKFFKENLVDNPPHYTVGGISTYDFIVAKKLSYELGNVVKYVSRADYKGNRLQDLQKALWYLNAAIDREEVKP